MSEKTGELLESSRSGLGALSFRDPVLEREFRDGYWYGVLAVSRFGMISAALLWIAFAYLDALVAKNVLRELWLIRFAIGLPTILACLLLSHLPAAGKRIHFALTPAATICGGCIIAMVAITDRPASDFYYAGIIIILFFTYTFIQLPVAYASFVGITCLIAYEYVALFLIQSPFEVVANNTYFLVATNYVGIFTGYSLERYRRKNFFQLRLIDTDRARLAELTSQLEDLSTHDPLTGLYNRRQLASHLRQVCERRHRDGADAAVMLLDLDDFKAVNDRYGHLAGDELLRRTARAIGATVRGSDISFRYGGDEFLVLLPDTTLGQAEELARRLVDRMSQFGTSSSAFDDAPGVSVGVAAINDVITHPDDLLHAADRALYRAKQQGKGRVMVSRTKA